MDSTQIQSSPAVVEALEGVYDTTAPEIDPHGDPIFKVAMKTDQGIKIFEINSYEYYRLKYGMQGQLRWQGDTLLSFEPWISENFPV